MPRIGIIIASTRDTRFADKPANWIHQLAAKRGDAEFDLIDIRDFNIPFFNEPASNAWMPTSDANAVKWQEKIAEYDGFIFVTSEYNRSIPASLKNALDQAYNEWVKKPMAIVAYGSVGGAFAADHLRTIAIELQMIATRFAVHIGGSDFFKVSPLGANADMSEIEANLIPGANAMLDNLVWYANVMNKARAEDAVANKAA